MDKTLLTSKKASSVLIQKIHDLEHINQTHEKELAFYRQIFAETNQGILTVDSSSSILSVNKYLLNLLGLSEDQMVGQRIYNLIDQAYHPKVRRILSKEFRLRSQSSRIVLLGAKHRQYVVNMDSQALTEGGGKYFGTILKFTDISNSWRSDWINSESRRLSDEIHEYTLSELTEEVMRIATSITESKHGYLHILPKDPEADVKSNWDKGTVEQYSGLNEIIEFNVYGNGVWVDAFYSRKPVVSNLHHEFVYKIPGGEDLISMPNELAVPLLEQGHVIAVLGVWEKQHPYSHDDVSLMAAAAKKLWPVISRKISDERLLAKNKELLQVEARLKHSNREYRKVSKDLSEINAELEIAKDRAELSDRLKSAFLCNMSHEIRTPMNGIVGFANMLKRDGLEKEKQEKFIDVIVNSAKRLLGILNDVLEIARIETKEVRIYKEDFYLSEIIESVINEHQGFADEKRLAFRFDMDPAVEMVMVHTDKMKFKYVLNNLISNAIKYTDKGHVEASCEQIGMQLVFCVKDTGKGIDPEMHRAIFEPFRQVDDNSYIKQDGTGLGLSISKAYVQMLGGKMELHSHAGHGSKFTFTLPYRPK